MTRAARTWFRVSFTGLIVNKDPLRPLLGRSARGARSAMAKGQSLGFLQLSPLGKGSCKIIENRLLPALSVRGSARSTQVARALRARFRLRISAVAGQDHSALIRHPRPDPRKNGP